MSNHQTHPQIDAFFATPQPWLAEMAALRAIALDSGLTEECKWNKPCYTLGGAIVAMIGPFKTYCILSFFKGALLQDPHGILVRQTENVQAARIVKCTSVAHVEQLAPILEAYLAQAIELEKSGAQVAHPKSSELEIPEELEAKFDEDPALRVAFTALTPGRQRGYVLFFAGAKQAKTRSARIEKFIPQILAGKGMDD